MILWSKSVDAAATEIKISFARKQTTEFFCNVLSALTKSMRQKPIKACIFTLETLRNMPQQEIPKSQSMKVQYDELESCQSA
jgi:hypothetical protein